MMREENVYIISTHEGDRDEQLRLILLLKDIKGIQISKRGQEATT